MADVADVGGWPFTSIAIDTICAIPTNEVHDVYSHDFHTSALLLSGTSRFPSGRGRPHEQGLQALTDQARLPDPLISAF